MAEISLDYWIVRHPSDSGAVIARFKTMGGRKIPDSVADYSDFKILSVPGESSLTDEPIDHSGLSDDERELLDQIYPAQY